jgi:hypothetical protein
MKTLSGKLRERDVLSLPDGMHGDGDYLWLRVRGEHRSWIVRTPRDSEGKRQEFGLGSVKRVSLAYARRKRDQFINHLQVGGTTAGARQAAKNAPGVSDFERILMRLDEIEIRLSKLEDLA